MTNPQSSADICIGSVQPGSVPEVFGRPEDVLDDPRLSAQEKRAVLASWASDANAVPHLPALRQLPDGSVVKLDDILHALKALDDSDEISVQKSGGLLWRRSFRRRRPMMRQWLRHKQGRDDDDDPPPCPVSAAIGPTGGGGAAFACAEPICA